MRWLSIALVSALASLALAVALPAWTQTSRTPAGGAAPAVAPAVVDCAEQFKTVCAAIHGANGRSDRAGVPVLAGNSSLCVITQRFQFREGRRKNEAMVAMAEPMTDADLRGFSDDIGTLAAVSAPTLPSAPDAERLLKAKALAEQHKCTSCHGADLAGGQQVPRIVGQNEDQLRQTLHDFKAGERPGRTRAMTEALSQVPVEDLDLLAFYAANIRNHRQPGDPNETT